jgi:phage terminase large subunit GpA-like protein
MPVRMSRVDVTHRGQVIKHGVSLWHVDAGYFKSLVHSRIDWPQDQPGAWQLPADVPDEYARQIVAESKITLPSGKVVWKRHDRENHALDCEVYAAAAARMLGIDRLRRKPVAPAAKAADEPDAPDAPPLLATHRTRRVGTIGGLRR